MEGRRVLYKHPNFHVPELEAREEPCLEDRDLKFAVYRTDKNILQARFRMEKQAERWIAFMKGERNAK